MHTNCKNNNKMNLIPEELKKDIALRVECLKPIMKEAGVETLLISGMTNIFYLSGRVFRGYIYVSLTEDPIYFVIRPADFEKEADVVFIRKPEQIPAELEKLGMSMPSVLGLEWNTLTYADTMRLEKIFADTRFVNASPVMVKARMIKTDYEVEQMRVDGMHQSAVYSRVPSCYVPDMTDLEFQIEIERVLRREGCLGYVRTAGSLMEINLGSVIAGDNADVAGPYDFSMTGAGADPSLPVGACGKILRPGMTVMVDMNGTFNGYQSDMTRVWRIGNIDPLAVKAHECSRRILSELETLGRPGVKCSELYERALAIVEEEGLSNYFMGHRQKAAFIGHGVGIELNESPVIMARDHTPLAQNMTIALEPKFVIPGVGAVGDENTYVVTPDGLRSLTIFPMEIQEL